MQIFFSRYTGGSYLKGENGKYAEYVTTSLKSLRRQLHL